MRVLEIQQGTEEWYATRNAVVTGSEVKRVYGTQSKDYMYELIANALAPAKEKWANEAMERGSELESDALTLYEIEKQDTEKVGFVLHDEYDWFGVSPDALVKKGKKYVGAVEIKCPDTKTHIKYLEEQKIPAEYKAQVMQYFLVCDSIEWLDFVSYDPRIQIEEHQLAIIRVTREELKDELDVAMGKLLKFREKWEELQTKYIF